MPWYWRQAPKPDSLSRMVGSPIPLIAGKGYSVTIEQPTNQLRQALLLGDVLIGLSPYKGALRFAGTLELSGINTRMDMARVRSIRRQVSRALDIPEAKEGGRAWMGMRPLVPDSLPVMGKLPSRGERVREHRTPDVRNHPGPQQRLGPVQADAGREGGGGARGVCGGPTLRLGKP